MSSPANCERPPANVSSAAGGLQDLSPWASLPVDLARLVGWRVLAGDLLDYVRFRAVCSDWRSATVSPRGHGITDPRFHPRRWMMLPEGHGLHPAAAGKKRFFNLSTGVFVRHQLPLLVDHLVLCPVEGLLLLQQGRHGHGNTLLLLHPFTGDVAELPSVASLKRCLRAHLNPHGTYAWHVDKMASLSVSAHGIPNIMIAILDFSCVVCATTNKNEQWSVLASWNFLLQGRPMSSRGSIYILQCSTGDSELQILRIDPTQYGSGLRPQPPKLIATCPAGTIYPPLHLVECDSEILLVGYTNYTISSRMLVYKVADLIQGSVVPLTSIQGNALLVRFGWSLSVSFKAMPTVVGDTVVGMYHDGKHITYYNLHSGTWSATPARLVMHDGGMKCTCSLIDHMYNVCHCDTTWYEHMRYNLLFIGPVYRD
ncbi:uncharacterized protein [Triticum aestivum]|uniref:uncharacterized protein n=1 Tax=Triticum aestivum TaxID=4565 RepID=UPI001D02524E|nr:uncharacterized protein LOC123042886 [Triticum aestivum]